MTLTITEALAEIKTIKARLEKRRENIRRYFNRDARIRDPLEKEGGTIEYVRRERQAISDLEQRIVRLRTAIAESNLATPLTVQGKTQSVFEWLAWRRDVSPDRKAFTDMMVTLVTHVRNEANKQGLKVTSNDPGAAVPEVIIAVDEVALAAEQEALTETLGALDGRLSLVNATTTIEIP